MPIKIKGTEIQKTSVSTIDIVSNWLKDKGYIVKQQLFYGAYLLSKYCFLFPIKEGV